MYTAETIQRKNFIQRDWRCPRSQPQQLACAYLSERARACALYSGVMVDLRAAPGYSSRLPTDLMISAIVRVKCNLNLRDYAAVPPAGNKSPAAHIFLRLTGKTAARYLYRNSDEEFIVIAV